MFSVISTFGFIVKKLDSGIMVFIVRSCLMKHIVLQHPQLQGNATVTLNERLLVGQALNIKINDHYKTSSWPIN